MGAPPRQLNDGNWNLLQVNASDPEFPFSDKGDNDSFEITYSYKQDKRAFRALSTMSTLATPFGRAYFVKQGAIRDAGQGLYEFDRTFASIPKKREEGASVSFTQQWWKATTPDTTQSLLDAGKYFYEVDYDIEEQTFTVDGIISYEYFPYRPEPLIHPRVFLLFGFLQTISSAPRSGAIVTQDSTVEIYKGGIFVRITPYALLK